MEIAVVESRITVYKTVTVLDDERKNEYYSLLLDHLVNYTRENTLKIIPLCSYISNCFKNNPYKYKDIWLNV
ncbi:N-acetyltransferase [Chryseobacterium sp. KCF3-3]|uniref:N-acetyltransferase n=1 Tax=Chryseobacterium sp. KCF3-3 TaxID=3231511 RepID=UPI0038B390E7